MKTNFRLLAVCLAVVTTAISCNKEQTQAQPETVTLNFVSDGNLSTKTVLNADNSVSWSKTGEKIRVYETITFDDNSTDNNSMASDEAVVADNGTATFAAKFTTSLDNKQPISFVYNAIYPATAHVSLDGVPNNAKVKGPSPVQNPTATSFDPNADVLIAKPMKINRITENTSLSLQFARIVALGKMQITGLAESDVVTKIRFTTPGKKLIGNNYVDLESGTVTEYGYATTTEDYIELQYTESEGISNNGTAYFTCLPTEINEGDKFTVTITTTGGTYHKTVTIPSAEKALKFKAGKSSLFSVDMSNNKVTALTIEEFKQKTVGDAYYSLTGTISDISNTDYGNFNLTDETGTVYVYGLTQSFVLSNDKSFADLGLKDGDVVTIVGKRSEYVNSENVTTAQVDGPAFFEKKHVEEVAGTWVEVTDYSSISDGKYIYVAITKSDNKKYYMKNTKATAAGNVVPGELSKLPTDADFVETVDMILTISGTQSAGFTIGNGTDFLGASTSTNDGVTMKNNTTLWTIEQNNDCNFAFRFSYTNSENNAKNRYLGLYVTKPNYRTYETINSNIIASKYYLYRFVEE